MAAIYYKSQQYLGLQQKSIHDFMPIFNKIDSARLIPKLLLIITLTFTFMTTPTIESEKPTKLILTQFENQYGLKAEIGNQQVKIMAHLSDEMDWIKADDCVLCQIVQGKKKEKSSSGQVCKESCSGQKEQGFKCAKSYCKKLKQETVNLPYYIEQGERAQLKLKEKSTGTKYQYKTILTTKMSEKIQQNGRINLLNGHKGFFGNQLILVKDHQTSITIYYYPQPQKQSQVQAIVDQLIPLYSDINIIEKQPNLYKQVNGKKGQVNGLILQGSRNRIQHKNGKNEQEDEEEDEKDEKDNDEQNEEDQQVNVFEITEIKLKELFKDQPNNIQSEKTEKQKSLSQASIPLQKSTAQFSIKTDKLLLPASIFKKFTAELIQRYFSDPKSSDEPCQFQQNLLSCQNKQMLKIQQLDNVTITLVLNQLELEFPIRALIETCRQKSCTFSMGVSKNKKSVIIGDFILNIFAMQYNKKQNHFVIYRLNNQWAQNFVKTRRFSTHEANFMWIFIVFLFKAIMFILKGIGIISLIVLGLNCIYHWRDVAEWFLDLLAKLTNKQLREQLKDQKLRSFNKMSGRIKDRLKKKFKKSSKFGQLASHSNHNLEEQIKLSSQGKQDETKLMSLQQLSDPSSVQEEDHDHESHTDPRKINHKEAILKQIEKEKEDLQKKMSTKGQLPQILKSPPKHKQISDIFSTKEQAQPKRQQKQKNQKSPDFSGEQQFFEFENTNQFDHF